MTNNEATILGAVIAIVGGVAAATIQARLQRRYERERERQQAQKAEARGKADLIAAIRIVRYELTSNGAVLSNLIASGTPTAPIQIFDTNYRSVQLILQHGLPDQLRKDLAEITSALLPLAVTKIHEYLDAHTRHAASQLPVGTYISIRQAVAANLQVILDRIQEVNMQLLDYLRINLGALP